MPSRANLEERNKKSTPSYGAPIDGPTKPNPDRDRERQEKLRKKPTAKEREKAIEAHEERGKSETRRRREDRESNAPKPPSDKNPIVHERDAEGRPVGGGGASRSKDIDRLVDEAQEGEKKEDE